MAEPPGREESTGTGPADAVELTVHEPAETIELTVDEPVEAGVPAAAESAGVPEGGPSGVAATHPGYTNEGLPYGSLMGPALPAMHRAFLWINRWMAVPIIRSGLSPAWGSAYAGYFVMLRTRGRKSGEMRDAPLGYGIADGAVYVMAGFGPRTQWYRNIQADPHVEVWLPGRSFTGIAEQVTDATERVRGLRAAAIGCGIVGRATLHLDARTAPDEELLRAAEGIPVVRIRPTGIAAGPNDPGGWSWVVWEIATTLLTLALVRSVVRRLRRAR